MALKAERFRMGDTFFSFAGTENQSSGVVQVSLQEGSELVLELNVCLDPDLMPCEVT